MGASLGALVLGLRGPPPRARGDGIWVPEVSPEHPNLLRGVEGASTESHGPTAELSSATSIIRVILRWLSLSFLLCKLYYKIMKCTTEGGCEDSEKQSIHFSAWH